MIHWKTKDGRSIPIRDMSDEHLRNTIRMLDRRMVEGAFRSIETDDQGGSELLEYYGKDALRVMGVLESYDEMKKEQIRRTTV